MAASMVSDRQIAGELEEVGDDPKEYANFRDEMIGMFERWPLGFSSQMNPKLDIPTFKGDGDVTNWLHQMERLFAIQDAAFNLANKSRNSNSENVASVASAVLKEARDLKHTAWRLKTEGLDHESISLYFEAALKFLYCASLLEEMNPSMLMTSMYSDTAKLCEYCAHEYERYKEMAAAALAYKCIEVAYMKVAYYKHSAASKDRHGLLAALQTVLPGESPSSSASDVDNLNNQGTVDKVASAKAAGSPQIAGNHFIAAHNRPNFMWLLSYANDLNCAFDATKRSQNAIAAASVSLEKDGVDGLSSVRKVLDFNFNNVEGLLQLVRLSMESISC